MLPRPGSGMLLLPGFSQLRALDIGKRPFQRAPRASGTPSTGIAAVNPGTDAGRAGSGVTRQPPPRSLRIPAGVGPARFPNHFWRAN